MATRFRALAAPVDTQTGDKRRFAEDALTHQPLPMPARWVREDVGGHDNAISVGRSDGVTFDGEQIWVDGYFFDDAGEQGLPRLAEDVAEAMYLAREGVIGLSVDLDDYEVAFVRAGTDIPVEMSDLEDPDLQIEQLITKGRIRSVTFVPIPAYAETNHTIELMDPEPEDPEAAEADDEEDEKEEIPIAVVASVDTAIYDIAAFTCPVPITGPTPITYDWDRGIVYGHVAPWGVCHEGFPDSCVLAPRAPGDGSYREFHVHRVMTNEGMIYAGRITAGGDHPSSSDPGITAHQVRREHDDKTQIAYVHANEDEFGIFVCGPLTRTDFDAATMQILSRRKVSSDWRETVDGLSMIEVLALRPGSRQVAEPAFPIRASFSAGRQTGLTMAISPEPPAVAYEEMFRKTAARLVREELDRAQAAGFARAQLQEALSSDARAQREVLMELLGG